LTFQAGDRVTYQAEPRDFSDRGEMYVGTVTDVKYYYQSLSPWPWDPDRIVRVAWDDGSFSSTNGASVLLRRLPIDFGSGKVA